MHTKHFLGLQVDAAKDHALEQLQQLSSDDVRHLGSVAFLTRRGSCSAQLSVSRMARLQVQAPCRASQRPS